MFKFNGGRGALICDVCHTIVLDRFELREADARLDVPALCDRCGLQRVAVPRALLLQSAHALLDMARAFRAAEPTEIRPLIVEATRTEGRGQWVARSCEHNAVELRGPLAGYNLDAPEDERVVYLCGQSDLTENGPWVVMAGPWKRPVWRRNQWD